ncbi:MAG: 1-acyl-sn-glycerol-3-phosphate acyltransferase [Muribaculaceae bacterium]|nr:1-acyl-sn-glycerol-3-phosphate acyltransferase [Muribaculaceae bacterium]MDE6643831.1 1-acyl-sn-glycerol-3-phosphate acyltransferase [Muribaculaceae bacterium]
MNLAGLILKIAGWSVDVTVPDYPKAIICVAPHTSNWDFILGKLAYASVSRKAGFLMKESWFFWPLGPIFKSIGGVPVVRRNKTRSLVDYLVEKYKTCDRLTLAITPEGTRSRTTKWHTGFLEIARQTDIPIVLGAIDYKTHKITLTDTFTPTGDNDTDMKVIKQYYSKFTGKNPKNFSSETE